MTNIITGPATDRPGSAADLRASRRRVKEFDPPRYGKVSDELMHYLIGQGLNGTEICDALWNDYGIEYTRQGVSKWRLVNNMPVRKRSKNREALIPWRVLVEHSQDRLLKFLQSESNLRDGLELDRSNRYRHAAVTDILVREGTVVYYDQTNGWHRVPPRAGIDTDLIYDPRKADDGSDVKDRNLWQ